jgi:hypothetical protein
MTADREPKAASQGPKEPKRSIQKRGTKPPVAEGKKGASRKTTAVHGAPPSSRSEIKGASASASPTGEDGPQTPLERAVSLAARFQRFAWDVAGVLVLAASLMTLLALPGVPPISGGQLLGGWAAFLRLWLGYGSLLVVIGGGLVGLLMLQRHANVLERIIWRRVFALEAAAISAWMLVTLAGGVSLERAEAGLDGGRLGWGVTETYLLLFGGESMQNLVFPSLIVGIVLVISLVVGLGLEQPIERVLRKLAQASTPPGEAYLDEDSAVSLAPLADQEHATITPAERKAKTSFVQAPFPQALPGRAKRRGERPAPAPR